MILISLINVRLQCLQLLACVVYLLFNVCVKALFLLYRFTHLKYLESVLFNVSPTLFEHLLKFLVLTFDVNEFAFFVDGLAFKPFELKSLVLVKFEFLLKHLNLLGLHFKFIIVV